MGGRRPVFYALLPFHNYLAGCNASSHGLVRIADKSFW